MVQTSQATPIMQTSTMYVSTLKVYQKETVHSTNTQIVMAKANKANWQVHISQMRNWLQNL